MRHRRLSIRWQKKAWPDTDYLAAVHNKYLCWTTLTIWWYRPWRLIFEDLAAALAEMKRVLKPEGTIAAYVWDHAGEMEFLRIYWDTVVELDPAAASLDEGNRFPICNPTV